MASSAFLGPFTMELKSNALDGQPSNPLDKFVAVPVPSPGRGEAPPAIPQALLDGPGEDQAADHAQLGKAATHAALGAGDVRPQLHAQETRSGPQRCTRARLAERRMPPELGQAPSLLSPLRDESLVRAGQTAQSGDGLRLGPVLVALALGRADRDTRHLGQQVRAVACDLPQFGCSGGLLVVRQASPAGVPLGYAVRRAPSSRSRSGPRRSRAIRPGSNM